MNDKTLSRWTDAYMALGQHLIDGAQIKGRECRSWAAEWIKRCTEYDEDPIRTPQILLNLCECDRQHGVRLDNETMKVEQRAYVKRREQLRKMEVDVEVV